MSTRLLVSLFAVSLLAVTTSSAFAYGERDSTYDPAPLTGWSCGVKSPLPDGSVYVGLWRSSGSGQSGIAKVRPDGTLDSAWQGGIASLPAGAGFILPLPAGGVIVAGGKSLTRLRADGSVDATYGVNGVATVNWNIDEAALGADGSVVLLGDFFVFAETWGFQRVSPDGKVVSDLPVYGSGGLIHGWSLTDDGSLDVAINGLIAAPELHRVPVDFTAAQRPGARVMPRAGLASWTAPYVAVDAAGGAVFAITYGVKDGFAAVKLIRVLPDGTIDAGFGQVPLSPHTPDGLGSFPALAKLSRSADGKWTVFFSTEEFEGPVLGAIDAQLTFAVRFGADGKPDPSFPANLLMPGDNNYVRLNTGKLLATISSNGNCQLERLLTDDEPRVDGILVEYFHPVLRHYFMTLDTFEAAILDANPGGWVRTGRTFPAWQPVAAPATTAVCRFYGDPVIGPNSHFYTPEGYECDGLIALQQSTPPGEPVWHLEGKPFRASLPSTDGTCPGNLDPVYRVFNGPVDNANGPTHRYTTDPALYAQMQSLGWLPEGAHFCVPPLGPR